MKIGIYDLNECSLLDYKDRLDIYKKIGFSSVGLYLDEKYMSNGENYLDIIRYARKIGLEVNQVHLDYKISNLICEDSNLYFEYIERKILEGIELEIPCLVLHASKGENAPRVGKECIQKLDNIMKKYEQFDIFLCFENVRDNNNLKEILNGDISNVGMCFDIGHAYCYDDIDSLFEECWDKILCSHIHNNYKSDTHNMLFDGGIDCKKIIKLLKELPNVDNCLEVFPKRGEILDRIRFEKFVSNCYKDYCNCLKMN